MSSLDNLLQTPPAELITDLKALRQERATIESKEAVIEQLLEMLSRGGGVPAEEIAELGASIAIGPLRNQIIQVFRSKGDEDDFVMLPVVVHQELVARGNRSATVDNVRVTMRRMAESKELERPLHDQLLFGLPGAVDTFPGGRDAFMQAFGGSTQ